MDGLAARPRPVGRRRRGNAPAADSLARPDNSALEPSRSFWGTIGPYASIARPDHWCKNVFMALGVVLAYFYEPALWGPQSWWMIALGVAATCIVASSNYVINEILDARYDRRPNLWVEPKGAWGKGSVRLIEIPIQDEGHDNIVAFWQPDAPVVPGANLDLSYRIYWAQRPPVQPTVAICVGTRIGRGGVTGFVQPNPKNLRKFVVDFAGGDLPLIPADAPVEPVINLSRGKVEPVTSLGGLVRVSPFLRPLPAIGGWRCTFDISWEGTEPIDIRLFLRLGPTTLTETWLYLWHPPYG